MSVQVLDPNDAVFTSSAETKPSPDDNDGLPSTPASAPAKENSDPNEDGQKAEKAAPEFKPGCRVEAQYLGKGKAHGKWFGGQVKKVEVDETKKPNGKEEYRYTIGWDDGSKDAVHTAHQIRLDKRPEWQQGHRHPDTAKILRSEFKKSKKSNWFKGRYGDLVQYSKRVQYNGKINTKNVRVTGDGFDKNALKIRAFKDGYCCIPEGSIFHVGMDMQNLAVSSKGGFSGKVKAGQTWFMDAYCMDAPFACAHGSAKHTRLMTTVETSRMNQSKFWDFMRPCKWITPWVTPYSSPTGGAPSTEPELKALKEYEGALRAYRRSGCRGSRSSQPIQRSGRSGAIPCAPNFGCAAEAGWVPSTTPFSWDDVYGDSKAGKRKDKKYRFHKRPRGLKHKHGRYLRTKGGMLWRWGGSQVSREENQFAPFRSEMNDLGESGPGTCRATTRTESSSDKASNHVPSRTQLNESEKSTREYKTDYKTKKEDST